DAGDLLGQCRLDLIGRNLLPEPVAAEFLDQARRHTGPQIGLDQELLETVERGLIELALGEDVGDATAQLGRGAGQAVAEAAEPAAPFGSRLEAHAPSGRAVSRLPSLPVRTTGTTVPAGVGVCRATGR